MKNTTSFYFSLANAIDYLLIVFDLEFKIIINGVGKS